MTYNKINIKELAYLISKDNKKIKQLKKVDEITFVMTSDTGITITAECYNDGIVRYVIEGTRSQMTLCYNNYKNKFVRKPYKEKPYMVAKVNNTTDNLLNMINSILK